MSPRVNILADPAFLNLRPMLSTRLAQVGAEIHAEQLSSLLDPLMKQTVASGFAEAGAHEGTIWLVDEPAECLVPAYNSGPHADRLVGKFKQPLNSGLVCMVFASEQPFLENEVWRNSQQNKRLDTLLRRQTTAMIAVPFYFLQACRGVISCVQLKDLDSTSANSPAPATGFDAADLACIQRIATLLSQLIEYRLLSNTVGWTSE